MLKFFHKAGLSDRFTVEYARGSDGSYPAEEFLNSLVKKDKATMIARIKRLAREGYIHNEDHFKVIRGELKGSRLFEFRLRRRTHIRLLGYFAPRRGRAVLTHGFLKKQNQTPADEIEKARKIRDLYERGVK